MFDGIIVSDLHLGSSSCQVESVCAFMEWLADEKIAIAKLILNGDVFESIDFRCLNRHHRKVLSYLRQLSNRMDIIWISGNHDDSAEIVSRLLGVTVKDEYVLVSGDRGWTTRTTSPRLPRKATRHFSVARTRSFRGIGWRRRPRRLKRPG